MGDAVVIVYAGSYDKYARIITDVDKYNEYRGGYPKKVCLGCAFREDGFVCKLNAYKGLC